MRELHRSYLVKNIGDKSAKYNWDAVNVRSITRIFATSKLYSLAGYKHHRHFPWCFLLKCKFLSLSSLDLFSFGVMLLWFPQLHAGRAPVSKTLWERQSPRPFGVLSHLTMDVRFPVLLLESPTYIYENHTVCFPSISSVSRRHGWFAHSFLVGRLQ